MNSTLIVQIIGALVIVLTPAILGRKCQAGPNEWLKSQPPGIVFGIVWMVLYALMAFSWWTLIGTNAQQRNMYFWIAIALTLVSFALNLAWIVTYGCGKKDARMALWIFVAYIMVVSAQIFACYRVNPVAGMALSPLLGWAVFAIGLNSDIVNRNGIKM